MGPFVIAGLAALSMATLHYSDYWPRSALLGHRFGVLVAMSSTSATE